MKLQSFSRAAGVMALLLLTGMAIEGGRLSQNVDASALKQKASVPFESDIEIALMLDVSGALCDDGIGPCTSSVKLDALKRAVESFASIALGNNHHESGWRVRVAIVPFATAVRMSNAQARDSAAYAAAYKKLASFAATNTSGSTLCITGRNEGNCSMPLNNEVLPLTASHADASQRIKALTASGDSIAALGVEWAELVLSPEWRDLWPASARVMDFGQTWVDRTEGGRGRFRKIAVLVTDDEIAIAQSKTAEGVANQQSINDRANQLCGTMRSNSIEIFVIGVSESYQWSGGKFPSKPTLGSCAKSTSELYLATTESIGKALKDVALKLARLHATF
jgi:hypothetical protein